MGSRPSTGCRAKPLFRMLRSAQTRMTVKRWLPEFYGASMELEVSTEAKDNALHQHRHQHLPLQLEPTKQLHQPGAIVAANGSAHPAPVTMMLVRSHPKLQQRHRATLMSVAAVPASSGTAHIVSVPVVVRHGTTLLSPMRGKLYRKLETATIVTTMASATWERHEVMVGGSSSTVAVDTGDQRVSQMSSAMRLRQQLVTMLKMTGTAAAAAIAATAATATTVHPTHAATTTVHAATVTVGAGARAHDTTMRCEVAAMWARNPHHQLSARHRASDECRRWRGASRAAREAPLQQLEAPLQQLEAPQQQLEAPLERLGAITWRKWRGACSAAAPDPSLYVLDTASPLNVCVLMTVLA